jgi:hypothetical protein
MFNLFNVWRGPIGINQSWYERNTGHSEEAAAEKIQLDVLDD